MPWRPEEAPRHTKIADTPVLCAMWSEVANKVLAETGDEGRAIRAANAVVARNRAKPIGDAPDKLRRHTNDMNKS